MQVAQSCTTRKCRSHRRKPREAGLVTLLGVPTARLPSTRKPAFLLWALLFLSSDILTPRLSARRLNRTTSWKPSLATPQIRARSRGLYICARGGGACVCGCCQPETKRCCFQIPLISNREREREREHWKERETELRTKGRALSGSVFKNGCASARAGVRRVCEPSKRARLRVRGGSVGGPASRPRLCVCV